MGNNYWKNQYVLWDYEISEIDEEIEVVEIIEIGWIKYNKKEFEDKVKDLKPII